MERTNMTLADRRPALVDELYAEAAEFLTKPRERYAARASHGAVDGTDSGAPPCRPFTRPGPLPPERPRLDEGR